MAAAVFLDTNLLVYPHDRREPERAERAVAVLDELAGTDPFRDGFRLTLP